MSILNNVQKTFKLGERNVVISTGVMARHTLASVVVDVEGTTVLATVCAKPILAEEANDFMLGVNFVNKSYASGVIPGSYGKREARPSDRETITSRLIDRTVRPNFVDGFMDTVQVQVILLSHNVNIEPDIPAMIAASAAISLSGLPVKSTMGSCRVGLDVEGNCVLLDTSGSDIPLDLIVAANSENILMVEAGAKEITEAKMLEALDFAKTQIKEIIFAIEDFKNNAAKLEIFANRNQYQWTDFSKNQALTDYVNVNFSNKIKDMFPIAGNKLERESKIDALNSEFMLDLDEKFPEALLIAKKQALKNIWQTSIKDNLFSSGKRLDGRDVDTIRMIDIHHDNLLAKAHGSALFTRGDTQALAVATLGTARDAIMLDYPTPHKDKFMLHYNFYPFTVGEVGMIGSPKRREIGHGELAKRAILPVLPDDNDYVVRVVSEILESDGSSSMATVCGSTLALLDAGINIKRSVAGIAMGLMMNSDGDYRVLSDILAKEDGFGDMDFKVAGTSEGITALQMDIKIDGINMEVMSSALQQAKDGRMHILNIMEQKGPKLRTKMADNAPKMHKMTVKPNKVKDIIGRGGATIKSIIDETGVAIDIEDSGLVTICSNNQEGVELAVKKIEDLTREVEKGQNYLGKIVKVVDFGAFVNIIPGRDGLLHVSQMVGETDNKFQTGQLNTGEMVNINVVDIDKSGKIKLKEIL